MYARSEYTGNKPLVGVCVCVCARARTRELARACVCVHDCVWMGVIERGCDRVCSLVGRERAVLSGRRGLGGRARS